MNDLSIYIHIPFCALKCGYCSFYSVVDKSKIHSYVDALILDIKNSSMSYVDYEIKTIYFGGGTPSFLDAEDIKKILDEVMINYNVCISAEITIEANPDSLSFQKLKTYKSIGINRISVGVQSFNDDELLSLGRIHTAKDAQIAIKNAQEVGFENISLDLIYNIPNSNINTLKASIEVALSLKINHISLYSLKLDEDCNMAKKNVSLPDEDEELKQYLFICDTLENIGYSHYEISNFAKKGYNSIHNTSYWKMQEYLGFGTSAHSYVNGKRFYNIDNIDEYIINQSRILEEETSITPQEEYVMLSLRLKEGINLDNCKKIFSKEKYEKMILAIKEIEKLQLGNILNVNFVLTNRGMYLSNAIISLLLF